MELLPGDLRASLHALSSREWGEANPVRFGGGRGPNSHACAHRLTLGELGKTRLGHHERATANMAAQE